MLMLSVEGWINGVLALVIMIFSIIIGGSFLYKAIKSKLKLLTYAALMLVFGWLFLLGTCIDFITVISTGKNANLPEPLLILISYMWFVFSGFFSYIYCTQIIIPEKIQLKRLIIVFVIIAYSLYEIFLFLDPLETITIIPPDTTGENLIIFYFSLGNIAPMFIIITIPLYLGLCGFGFLWKGIQSTGVLKKKYIYISIGIFFYTSFNLIEGTGFFIDTLFFVRIGLLFSVVFWYLGLREEPAEKARVKVKKEIKVENGLIRLTKRPNQITEEEVSISKEKKICLVCKGKVGGFSFICNECGTFYCQNCASSLIKLENACWVCNSPFDKSKPSKPQIEEEDEDVDIKEKVQREINSKK